METNKKTKNLKQNIVEYTLAFVLFIYPFRKISTGIDLMDAGYSLGNYRFAAVMDKMWKLATYLANITGELCTRLPFGDTWIGMNFYTSFFIGITASGCYIFMVKSYGQKNKIYKYLFFVAELVALSLCWAPSVILYHYLGYIMMTVAVMVLYKAIINDDKKGYVIAGVILGLSVSVRMPNVTYMVFILSLWYFCFIKKEDNWFGILINRTFICIAGYLAGLIIPIAVICIKYGIEAYPQMIASLFGMTDKATDYKPTSMITGMLGDYFNYSAWLVLFILYTVFGVVFFRIKDKFLLEKRAIKKYENILTKIFKTGYVAGLFVVLYICYARGMFNFDYSGYFSIYKLATVYLLMVILLCTGILLYKDNGYTKEIEKLKLWSVFVFVIIFITPLGGNNELYPIINNLFIIAPVSVYMFGESYELIKNRLKEEFALKAVIVFFLSFFALQSIGFGADFIFHDTLTDSEERVTLSFADSKVANGLKTSEYKKTELEGLEKYLIENELKDKKVILYGDSPALAYIFDMEPAIYTTWADLDSKDMERLQADLNNICSDYPVVVFDDKAIENIDENSFRYEKLLAIKAFMEENNYIQTYKSDKYSVHIMSDVELLRKY